MNKKDLSHSDSPQEVIAAVKKAEELISKGNFTDLVHACDAIHDALDIVPDDPILHVTLGKIFLQSRLFSEDVAYHELAKAAKLSPHFAWTSTPRWTLASPRYGQTGNQLWQISNMIFFCLQHKYECFVPETYITNSFSIDRNGNFTDNQIEATLVGRFQYPNEEFDCDETKLNHLRSEICKKYILPNIKLHNKNLDRDTIVVHLRSGDIFSANPYPVFKYPYLPPPLSFLLYAIKPYKKAIIVTQDMRNPLLFELKQQDNVFIQSSSLLEDASTVFSAKNLVIGCASSLSLMIAWISNNLEKLFHASLLGRLFFDSKIKYIFYDLENIYKWENSDQQIETILKHELDYSRIEMN